jgi:hypothetical protein
MAPINFVKDANLTVNSSKCREKEDDALERERIIHEGKIAIRVKKAGKLE